MCRYNRVSTEIYWILTLFSTVWIRSGYAIHFVGFHAIGRNQYAHQTLKYRCLLSTRIPPPSAYVYVTF